MGRTWCLLVLLLALGPVVCSDIRHGKKDTAPQLDASVTLTSCLQLEPCCTRGHDLQQISRAFLSPALLVEARDLGIWSAPWDRACVCALFCSTPSLAQTNESHSKSVSPSQCPVGTEQILSGWEQLHAHPSHPLEEVTCKHHSKLVPHAGSQTQSLPGKDWTASVSPLAPSSIHTILMAAEQKGAIASLLLP